MIDFARPVLGEEEQRAVQEVMESGLLASGTRVRRLEEEFASYIGCRYGVATANGTTALHLALLAGGIGPGDKVITTPFTFIATANAIRYCGARPIFADIDPPTFNLSPAAVRAALKRHPDVRALLVVHLFGLPCPMTELTEIAAEHGLILIEDAAQAHGASYRGRKVGSFGMTSAFSFYATKNMTTGEGGMVLTQSARIARTLKSLVNHGRVDRYEHDTLGFNYRMTNLAAAIGLVQLKRLEEFNARRARNAAYLSQHLADLEWLQLPAVPEGCQHVYHQYTVRTPVRDDLARWLTGRGIGNAVIYPIPLHRQPLYRNADVGGLPLANAEQVAQEVLSLPVHPSLSAADLEAIVQAVRAFPLPALQDPVSSLADDPRADRPPAYAAAPRRAQP